MMGWIAWQTSDPRANTLDARLASDAGWSKTHVVDFELGDNWNHPRSRTLCGATAPAGDDLDVMAFRSDERNLCKRCVDRLAAGRSLPL